jgi:predicted HAD superfamily hydrolase
MKSRLERKIDRAQVASFDVFDTAVLRKIDWPQSLFHLMLPGISAILGARAPEFPSVRTYAESRARMLAQEARKSVEVKLLEIYEVLGDYLNLEAAAVQQLCQHEIQAELAICCQNPFIYSLYRRCIDQGNSVVFISDMYLPEAAVGAILKNCGYLKYDALLVSSETGNTKAQGKLYANALERIALPPKQWLHIGDNPHSDVRMARKRGMATWQYVPPAVRFAMNRERSKAWRPDRPVSATGYVVKGLIANRIGRAMPAGEVAKPNERFWEDFGYTSAGPLYVGFTEWLLEQTAKHNLDAIYFLARDGFIIQRLFEAFQPAGLANVEMHYLYASRRALKFATIRTIDDQTLQFLTQSLAMNEVGTFLKRIGLDPQSHADAVRRAGFRDIRHVVRSKEDFEHLKQLIKSLSEPICERARSEREVMRDYLLKSGLCDGRRVALVDVGWHGSQQQSIREILEAERQFPDIRGFYLGTFSFAASLYDAKCSHDAYLTRLGLPPEYANLLFGCVEIFELMFSTTEGSLVRMERTPSGDFTPIRHPVDRTDLYRNESVEKLQVGAMQFVADYLSVKREFPDLAMTPEIAITEVRRVLREPAAAEARHLGDITHTRDFGDSMRVPIAPRLGALALLGRRRYIRWQEGTWRAGIAARSSWLYRILYRLRMGSWLN